MTTPLIHWILGESAGAGWGWEARGSASPFMWGEWEGFCRSLNCGVLGWCGLGCNNTLCLCSFVFLRSSKSFPDIISLFPPSSREDGWGPPHHSLVHPTPNGLRGFSHNHILPESSPGSRRPDFWPPILLLASRCFQDRLAAPEAKIYWHYYSDWRDLQGSPGERRLLLSSKWYCWWINWLERNIWA